jgi:hypothetical protein
VQSSKLRYYIHDRADSCQIQLLGILADGDVPELQGCWNTIKTTLGDRSFVLDLRGLDSSDDGGQRWVQSMQAEGARLIEHGAKPAAASGGILRRLFCAASTQAQ